MLVDVKQKKTRETKEAARKQQKEAAEAAALLEVGELDDDEDEWDIKVGPPKYVSSPQERGVMRSCASSASPLPRYIRAKATLI